MWYNNGIGLQIAVKNFNCFRRETYETNKDLLNVYQKEMLNGIDDGGGHIDSSGFDCDGGNL